MTFELIHTEENLRPAASLREDWLSRLAKAMEAKIEEATGCTLPPYRVSCGWPSTRALPSGGSYVAGQCWHSSASSDGHAEIFVTPLLDDVATVAAILAHELLHAALPAGTGHKKPFQDAAKKIGHEAPFTQTKPTDAFFAWAQPLIDATGAYPHGRIRTPGLLGALIPVGPGLPDAPLPRPEGAPKAQKNRMHKCECPTCGYVARVSRKWLLDAGAPLCPSGHGPLAHEHLEVKEEEKN